MASSTGNRDPSARSASISKRWSRTRGSPAAVAGAQIRWHDQLGHLAADRILAAVAERPLGGGVELHDASAMVHRHDAVQGGLQRRPVSLLARVPRVLGAPTLDELAQ